MIRKQIYLTPQIDTELNILARSRGKSVAEVVRSILEKSLKVKNAEKQSSLLLDLANMGFKGGPKDLSANLFDYLYGDKSPNYGRRKKVTGRR
ncbi:MAG: hypothetical protein Q8Q91_00785 [Candidatus Daviesbacteria bacterium]|nr:hypothetical protein [Candidatus Daviesbacteria bacterium]